MILVCMATKTPAGERVRAVMEPGALVVLCVAAWLVPGAGHLWQRRRQKGLVFVCVLPLMFLIGLWLKGTIFPFQFIEPLSGLAAVAQFGAGLPWFLSRLTDTGGGTITAATWEYGNTFMIVSGLLNFLVILDAFDIGMGRK